MKTVWMFEFDLEGSFDYARAKECTIIDEYDGEEYYVEYKSISMYPVIHDWVDISLIDDEEQFYPRRSFYRVWFSTYEKGLIECSKIIDERIAEHQKKIANFELMKKWLEEK